MHFRVDIMEKISDLIGKTFGKLTVIEQAPTDARGARRWVCQCECGKQTVALSSNLTSGQTKNCGCIKQNDLTGKKIGRLTFLGRSDKYGSRGKRKTRLWECRCDCGAITYKATDVLTNPDISMCQNCAGKYAIEKSRIAAGYVDGTQISRIMNVDPKSDSISGIRGVYYERKTGKYRASLQFRGKTYSFGTYSTPEEAAEARRLGEFSIFGEFLEEIEYRCKDTK